MAVAISGEINRPGTLPLEEPEPEVPFSDQQVVEMAERCNFEPRHRIGAGEQYFWLWFFKR